MPSHNTTVTSIGVPPLLTHNIISALSVIFVFPAVSTLPVDSALPAVSVFSAISTLPAVYALFAPRDWLNLLHSLKGFLWPSCRVNIKLSSLSTGISFLLLSLSSNVFNLLIASATDISSKSEYYSIYATI
ncbi:hypothetical protein Tco_1315245 [Tanacetum coccineum]